MYKLYGIPNCDTVKKARTFLDKKKIEFDFVDFKKMPPTPELIKKWAQTFGGLPVNNKGVTYKKYKEEFEVLPESKKILFLCEHSSMIKRPILERADKTLAFGFDEAEYQKHIGK